MKPFEELYTAWIDGTLAGAELEEFEASLPDRAAAEADRAETRACGDLLRRHAGAPSLANPEFFSYQLRERLGAEERLSRPEKAPKGGGWFSLPNLAWACSFAAVTVAAYYAGQTDRFTSVTKAPADEYRASIIKSSTQDPTISASVYAQENGVTVLWLDGLDYLPASYKLE
jgi:hypothetical protein